MSIEAVIWDMGGVILRTEDAAGRRKWAARLDLSLDELTSIVFEGVASRRASVGKASTEDVWRAMADRFGLSAEERGQLERDFWRGDQVDYELLDYIQDLRSEHKTALLSNAWPDVRLHIEETWDFADRFDHIVISAEVGLVKPDPRIYQLVLDKLSTPAEQAVFIDDFPENVAGARRVGMEAILFESTDQVKRELAILLDT